MLPVELSRAENIVQPDRVFGRPTSVFLAGSSRPLLNWVAYALASATDPGFIWTDVRLWGEVLVDVDPLARNLVRPNRLRVVRPNEMARDDAAANVAIGGVIRDEQPSDAVRRMVDFLRLPPPAKDLLSETPVRDRPIVLVLSNGHRLVALYPPEAVGPVVGAIVEAGAIMFMTWADAPPEGRHAFETVLHVEGNDPKEWRRASLRVEKGPSAGPLRTGSAYRLGEFAPVAAVLARDFK